MARNKRGNVVHGQDPTTKYCKKSSYQDPSRPFEYRPLSLKPNAIRVVRVKGVSESGRIICRIDHEVITPHLCYNALSYTWGDEDGQRIININGHTLRVRHNLWLFLHHAARTSAFKDVPFWIDAICIDQDRLVEKNHQVQLMDTIYSKAQKVIVWLGCSTDSCQVRHNRSDDVGDDLLYLFEHVTQLRPPPKHVALLDDGLHDGVNAFTRHEYWSRTWIVQELLLARHLEVMYHEHLIEWDTLWNHIDNFRPNAAEDEVEEFTFTHRKQRLHRFDYTQNSSPTTLHQLLVEYTFSQCLDIRDRVFGLLSLAERGTQFPVDYTDTPSSLAIRACQFFHGDFRNFATLLDTLEVSPDDLFNQHRWETESVARRRGFNPEDFITFQAKYDFGIDSHKGQRTFSCAHCEHDHEVVPCGKWVASDMICLGLASAQHLFVLKENGQDAYSVTINPGPEEYSHLELTSELGVSLGKDNIATVTMATELFVYLTFELTILKADGFKWEQGDAARAHRGQLKPARQIREARLYI